MTRTSLPTELAQRSERVIRPRDLADLYAHPRAEVARMARSGVLHRVANGYYALPPLNRLGDSRWTPDLNAVAMGVGQVDYGVSSAALMGISAAYIHGAVPRRLAVAVLAIPKQRPPLPTANARIVFVKRDVSKLDVERTETELGIGWVTTLEQTALDLATRPTLGGIGETNAHEAIQALMLRADWPLLEELATTQHRPRALATITALTGRKSDA
ncbi:type IV toxin-antitoxin system AbiEi family antitoxin [Amycolatopsis sp. NPDC057786]|uniref:type IV toxin-antitoxin system AbiEi family antitoxin domain-containing protein n=1 Tax=Amycolatopsis sp. NPDC057786 TaxID=3346250 RepID=UPI00366BA46B